MPAPPRFLALDLGASSGRAVRGTLVGGRLAMEEIRRWPNAPVEVGGRLCWDLDRLHREVRESIEAAAADEPLASAAVDTWGVDFALLDESGAVLGPPVCYRDRRTEGAMEAFFALLPRERLYARTGIQMMPINTLFQLFAMVRDNDPALDAADALLFMPDALVHRLTGARTCERTIAGTSQLLDVRSGTWDPEILEALRIDAALLGEVVEPGTRAGAAAGTSIVLTASHDTAAAVAAVPAEGDGWAYVSSGTWSLVGVERGEPETGADALELNMTNEAGVGGRTRFLTNVMGLWLLSGCREAWARGGLDLTFPELVAAAEAAEPLVRLLDPDWPGFLAPPDMPAAIGGYLEATGQPRPANPGEVARAIFDSLALRYAETIDLLNRFREEPLDRVHVVGGGARNALLCRLTADATGLPVLAGPAEATAAGNLLVQAMAAGLVDGLEGIREVSRRSFAPVRYEPRDDLDWRAARARWKETVRRKP